MVDGENGLILAATVGIGYGTPWRQMEAMRLEGAHRTPRVREDPPPFIRQQALGACRLGTCDLRLGDQAIGRFQAEVDWAAPDAARRASLLVRQLMLGHAQAYLKGGDAALGIAHNERTPRVAADEFHALFYQSKTVYEVAPTLAASLDRPGTPDGALESI